MGSEAFEKLTGRWFELSQTKVPNQRIKVDFSADDAFLVYELETEQGRRLVSLELASGESGPQLDPGLEWKSFRAEADGAILLETKNGWRRWQDGHLSEASPPEKRKPQERRSGRGRGERGSWLSPDGKQRVVVDAGKLLLRDEAGDGERVLLEKIDDGVFRDSPLWAPDSSRFVIWKTKPVALRQVHYVESSPKNQLQPKNFTRSYPKPGDELDTRAPWTFFIDGREPLKPDLLLIKDPFQCRKLAWRGDSRRFTYEFIERGFGKYRVIEVNSETRKQVVLIREESDTFVHVYGNSFRHDLNDGEEILWMSERDGWKHLYLLDGRDGSVKRQLTKGQWVVREVVKVVKVGENEVLLKVAGRIEGQDPYYIHYARVDIRSGELVALTHSDGTHDRFQRSPGGKYYTCRWSRVDHPPVTELRRWEDGSLVKVLAKADAEDLMAADWLLPERFVAKDREGKYDIHGIVIFPPDFDPAKMYPVVEKIYAGPHGSFVAKAWRPWMAPDYELAVHGFIVVQIDGRGTANRSKAFQDYCYKNLKDAGFPDRIAWIKAAARKYPQMDLERVGIFGGSAGGQSALGALLFHGDFYKAAAADCGCHDNRMDKIWWNEQWMDWPVGPEYADNSNVTHAGNLQGALLLTVGELDTNVDPSSTYQVIDALITADKDFEFLPMVGKGHGSGETRYAQRRRVDFFRRHLGVPVER